MMILHQKQKKRMEIFVRINKTLSAALTHFEAKRPREWLKERGLTPEVTGAGFCSGQLNKKKSKIRARVEHIFGFMTNTMNEMYLRYRNFVRNQAGIGLINLTYNLFRLVQLKVELKS